MDFGSLPVADLSTWNSVQRYRTITTFGRAKDMNFTFGMHASRVSPDMTLTNVFEKVGVIRVT